MSVCENGVDRSRSLYGRGHTEDLLSMVDQRGCRGKREVRSDLSTDGVVVRTWAAGRIVLALDRGLVREFGALERWNGDAECEHQRREPDRDGLPDHLASRFIGRSGLTWAPAHVNEIRDPSFSTPSTLEGCPTLHAAGSMQAALVLSSSALYISVAHRGAYELSQRTEAGTDSRVGR